MRKILKIIFFIKRKINTVFSNIFGHIVFYANGITCESVKFNGIAYVSIQGEIKVGKNLRINSAMGANPIGRNTQCIIVVRNDANLNIGDNVGMSGTAIVCQKNITIGNNVKMGGNVCIYDTDFHSLNATLRSNSSTDKMNTTKKAVHIGDNVFIGAHTTVLKGVSIGENSIIGACSVVTKSIPANEIWAGNPAKYIKSIPKE